MEEAPLVGRLARFQVLRDLRELAAAENLEAVKREDAELRLNPRTRARLDRKKAEAERFLARQNAASLGVDLERLQGLQYTAGEVADWARRQADKQARADQGFTDYNQMALRRYEKQVARLGAGGAPAARPSAASALLGAPEGDDPARVQALVAELRADDAARQRLSKRRKFDEGEDVTYINLRNYRFNKKIGRAYDKYTQDLKDNLERGTAL